MALSNKQQVFVEAYLICWNSSEAARRAGYSDGTARQQGSRLLTNVDISTAIEARLKELTMSSGEVLARLTEHARGDIGEFLELPVKNLRQHPRSHLLKKVKQTTTVRYDITESGEREKELTETVEFEMYDSQAALNTLAKYHKLFSDAPPATGPIIFNVTHTPARTAPPTIEAIPDDADLDP